MQLKNRFGICSIKNYDIAIRVLKSLISAAFMLALCFKPAFGQEAASPNETPSNQMAYGFESDLASKYIWRGLAFSQGAVSQNSIYLSRGNITGSLWLNYDFNSPKQTTALNEYDVSIAYASSLGKFDYEGSVQTYLYPKQIGAPSTAEIAFNLSYGLSFIRPFTIQTIDIKEYRGAYFGEFGVSLSQEFNSLFSLDAVAELGWGSGKFNTAYIGDYNLSVELASVEAGVTCNITNQLYLRPHLLMTSLINEKIKSAIEKPNLFQIGLALGGEF
jgi:hypothetical protein